MTDGGLEREQLERFYVSEGFMPFRKSQCTNKLGMYWIKL